MQNMLMGGQLPLLVMEKIFSYISPRDRVLWLKDPESNPVKDLILKSTNLSSKCLQFWSNVQVPSYEKMELPLAKNKYFYDRAIRKLSTDFIWIINNRNAFHFELYFTDLINVYLMDTKAVKIYKKLRNKKYRHPSFLYPHLSKYNELLFDRLLFVVKIASDIPNWYINFTDSELFQELYPLSTVEQVGIVKDLSIGKLSTIWYCYQRVKFRYNRFGIFSAPIAYNNTGRFMDTPYRYFYRNSYYYYVNLPQRESFLINFATHLAKPFSTNGWVYYNFKGTPHHFLLSCGDHDFVYTRIEFMNCTNVVIPNNSNIHSFGMWLI